jgi:hypothetical protein
MNRRYSNNDQMRDKLFVWAGKHLPKLTGFALQEDGKNQVFGLVADIIAFHTDRPQLSYYEAARFVLMRDFDPASYLLHSLEYQLTPPTLIEEQREQLSIQYAADGADPYTIRYLTELFFLLRSHGVSTSDASILCDAIYLHEEPRVSEVVLLLLLDEREVTTFDTQELVERALQLGIEYPPPTS